MNKKPNAKKFRFKPVALALVCAATSSVFSFAAACSSNDDDSNTDDPNKTTSEVDEQLIKNGNFEFYSENEKDDGGVYFISDVKNFTNSSAASPASDVKSGIIGTSASNWAALSDKDLPDVLDANNDLDTDADDYDELYKDYNGLKTSDLPFIDTEAATADDATDADRELIANPLTHYTVKEENGSFYYLDDKGEKVTVYKNADGDYFTDEEMKTPLENHILMIHNYTLSHKDSDKNVIHNGTAQSYTSSTTVTLEANTAAEISVWVKTANLIFNNGNPVHQDRGAYVQLSHTVGGTTLDSLYVKNINTEKLISEGAASDDNNGWIKYTFYIQACDFAESTVTVSLGLGEENAGRVEGYAFFDDLSITKYVSLDDENCSYEASTVADTTCTILSEADEKIFYADSVTHNNSVADERNSKNFHYLLDLTAQSIRTPVAFMQSGVEMGLTIDASDYRSSENAPTPINATSRDYSDSFLLKHNIGTEADILANLTVNGDKDAIKSALPAATKYADTIADALYTANTLPGVDGSTQALVLLSARGAAYTADIASANDFTLAADSYAIVSFWVKTSDMNGKTAATLAVYDAQDKTNKQSFTLDTSSVTFDLNDEEDIYNGWVQCFFFIRNDTEETKEFKAEFSFGNTTISGANVSSFAYGYAMLANMQVFEVDEKEFNLASNNYTATLTFSDSDTDPSNYFDSVYNGLSNQIKDTVAPPANYESKYGGSTGTLGQDDAGYNTGLINKDYFEDYLNAYKADKTNEKYVWLDKMLNAAINNSYLTAIDNADEVWNAIFGARSVQPLLIVNTVRTFANNDKAINYGYLGAEKSVSASSYAQISVKVKVSKGAIAYVYLTNENKPIAYEAPLYSFWYDDDGNVLKAEPNDDTDEVENIAYKTRTDGLYEDENGTVYANLYNYGKLYLDESVSYYDEDGNAVLIDDIYNKVVYKTYYTDAAKTTLAPHYLVTSDKTRVFKYENGEYKYLVKGEATTVVKNFDTSVATPRYDFGNIAEECVIVDGNNPEVANKWITVNFYIHTGNVAQSYRVELWNGERTISGLDENDNVVSEGASAEGSYIIFDYSYTSLDESSFNALRSSYEEEIKEYYVKELIAKNIEIASATENLAYYEKLAKANDIAIPDNYKAYYYTFSLYDSTDYLPYNEDVAEAEETDYDYSIDDYSETLAYLVYQDKQENVASYSVFADYSAIHQSVTRTTAGDDTDDDDTTTDTDTDGTTVWLLVSSILLVIALLVTLISMFLRDFLKKHRRNKKFENNKYNAAKRKHYMKRLKLEEDNGIEEDSNGAAEPEDSAADVSEASPEKPADEPASEEPSDTDETENGEE